MAAPDRNRALDLRLLRRAVELSKEKMLVNAGGPFGAVIATPDGEIVGEGWNRVTSESDPTAHAEITAIRAACARLGRFELSGLTIYSSCEPCPMCLSAIYWARLDRLYYAATRTDAAEIGFDDAFLYTELTLDPSQRQLPSVQALRERAQQVMLPWKQMPGSRRY